MALRLARDADHFLEGSDPAEDPAQPVLSQPAHCALRRMRAQALLGARPVDQRLRLVVDHQQLVDAAAPDIAGVVAGGAAARRVQSFTAVAVAELCEIWGARLVRPLARAAELAHQPLRQDAEQAR